MRAFAGGEGMPTFVARITRDATSGLTDKQRKHIAPLIARKPLALEIPASAKNRRFVRPLDGPRLGGCHPAASVGLQI